MGLVEYFGTLGMILAYCIGISPIPALYQGFKDKEINNITLTYFLSAVSNCLLWTIYGMKKNDNFLCYTNGVLFFLFINYLGIFLYIKKEEFYIIGSYYVAILIATLIIANLIPTEVIGFGAFLVNSIWSLSAIENLRECLKKKDPKLVNIQISFVSSLCSFSWLSYGILSGNIFVVIPNIIGNVLWTANIIAYYWSNEKINDDNLMIVCMKKIFFYNQPEYQSYNKSSIQDSLIEKNINTKNFMYDFKTTKNDRTNM